MFKFAAAAFAAALLVATPVLADDATDPEIMATIKTFSDGMAKGDTDKIAAAQVANPTIIDEFSPYLWTGNGSIAAWGGDFQKDATAKGISEPKLVVGKVQRALVDGDKAYVVAAANYTFKQNGMIMGESATITMVLNKTADGWKIAAWSFNF
ncbi:MAG TPA: nuclear transport factor 2 family protein [Rhizomicrobium sp.]|jgi:hypothetical protein|nr:nuclear transport factor 2 family protein [Rhizomicrobium sp.]